MKRRKHRYRGYSKRTIVLFIALFCSLFFGLGYSLLGTSLDLSGMITVSEYDDTLYGVLAREGRKGVYAKKYTDAHLDSIDTSLSTKDIYYWHASNSTNANTINEMNNVIFADHCWQMFRTTDTGGVKLIYNGEAVNQQCLSSRGTHIGFSNTTTTTLSTDYYYSSQYYYDETNSTFGLKGIIDKGEIKEGYFTCKSTNAFDTCANLYMVVRLSSGNSYTVAPVRNNSPYSMYGKGYYNEVYNSLAHLGYMYNTIYPKKYFRPLKKTIYDDVYMYGPSNYYYGDGVTYNDGMYTLTNPFLSTWNNIINSASGYYTCRTSGSTSCASVYYIVGGTYAYGYKMTDGHMLNDYDNNIVLGQSIVDNGNGTYTISGDTITIKKSDWFNDHSNYVNYYLCEDGSSLCAEPRYITETDTISYDYYTVAPQLFGNSFSYNNGKYTLSTDKGSVWKLDENEAKTFIENHHYTCFNDNGECSTIYYVYYMFYDGDLAYIELNDGKSVEDALNEMLYNDDVNNYSSAIKIKSEAWYRQFLMPYSDYLEDFVFCSGRTEDTSHSNGWHPNGGVLTWSFDFNDYGLNCLNDTDRYSINNSKAKLDYPIGLIKLSEASLLGNDGLRNVGKSYWTSTIDGDNPNSNLIHCISNSGGTNTSCMMAADSGFRWVVSLKPGTKYLSGDGSTYHPYVIDNIQNTTFTIYYRYSNGGEAAPSYVGIYKPGEPFSIPSPTIENYDTMNHVVSGTKAPGNQSATVWYTYNGGSIIDPDTPLDP